MIVFLRKSSFFVICIIFVCTLTVTLLATGSLATPTSENFSFGKFVIIDAGHGEPDGGAVGTDGTKEADLNLQIATKLNNLLLQADIQTAMTRTNEMGLFDSESKTIAQKKRADMKKRKEIQSSMGADIFCSIHINHFSQSKYHGAQVVYDTKNNDSKLLAECIQSSLKEFADKDNNRVAMGSDGSIFLLKNASIPSVIVECGFMSNENELALLKTDEYQNKIAWAVFKGIEDYYRTKLQPLP